MSGNIFSDVEPLSAIETKLAKKQVSVILEQLGVERFSFVGSSADDGPCGDIDVTTSVEGEVANEKSRLFLAAQTILGTENVKKVGQLIALRLFLDERSKPYQVDIFPAHNIRCVSWLMRGLFRHMLFALLAKYESERVSDENYKAKLTISVPDGIQLIVNDYVVVDRTNDPATILSLLGLHDVRPSEVLDLQNLVSVVKQKCPEVLPKYASYVAHLSNKKGYAEALALIAKHTSDGNM